MLGLAMNLQKARHRHAVQVDKIPERCACTHGRQLVRIANEHEPRASWIDRVEQCVEQFDVDHRALVDDDPRIWQWVAGVVREAVQRRVVDEQAVDGAGVLTCDLDQSTRGAPGRGRGGRRSSRGARHLEQRGRDGTFAHARSARQDHKRTIMGEPDRGPLLLCERDVGLCRGVVDGLIRVGRERHSSTVQEGRDPRCDATLGAEQGTVADRSGRAHFDEVAIPQLGDHRAVVVVAYWNRAEPRHRGPRDGLGREGVAVGLGVFAQHVHKRGGLPFVAVTGHAGRQRDRVGPQKPDAVDVPGEVVGVGPDRRDGACGVAVCDCEFSC